MNPFRDNAAIFEIICRVAFADQVTKEGRFLHKGRKGKCSLAAVARDLGISQARYDQTMRRVRKRQDSIIRMIPKEGSFSIVIGKTAHNLIQ